MMLCAGHSRRSSVAPAKPSDRRGVRTLIGSTASPGVKRPFTQQTAPNPAEVREQAHAETSFGESEHGQKKHGETS
jgi:hypothetical protein